jgi:excisionase family DNA binding protein
MSPRSDWVSIKEYATLYNVHPNTVAKWIQAGLLIAWKARRTVRIKRQPPLEHRPGGIQPTS